MRDLLENLNDYMVQGHVDVGAYELSSSAISLNEREG